MQSSAYNSDDLRLFSAVHSDALKAIQEVAGGPLVPTGMSGFSRRLAQDLMSVFDAGERNPAALRRAALKEFVEQSPAFPRERTDLETRPVDKSAAKFPNNETRHLFSHFTRSATRNRIRRGVHRARDASVDKLHTPAVEP